jgi:predicted nucleotidyltransferase
MLHMSEVREARPSGDATLQRLIDRVVERMQPEAIWLIGSRAEGRARPDSDYDLLVVVSDGTPENALDPVKAWEVARGLGIPADVIPCTRLEFEEEKNEVNSLPRVAVMRGSLIYERRA